MSCSICGSKDHNARTCPYKNKGVPRDHALWMKFDNMTQREAQGVVTLALESLGNTPAGGK
jgi:hypothetical protein